jgi:hypothetical protein
MGGCTLLLARNSPLRTTLVDEATGHAKYQVNTPLRIHGSVTTIKKFDLPPQPPLIRDEKTSFGPGGDITDKGKKGKPKRKDSGVQLPENGEEVAKVNWSCFSSDKITFGGNVTARSEFLPQCGKMKK